MSISLVVKQGNNDSILSTLVHINSNRYNSLSYGPTQELQVFLYQRIVNKQMALKLLIFTTYLTFQRVQSQEYVRRQFCAGRAGMYPVVTVVLKYLANYLRLTNCLAKQQTFYSSKVAGLKREKSVREVLLRLYYTSNYVRLRPLC